VACAAPPLSVDRAGPVSVPVVRLLLVEPVDVDVDVPVVAARLSARDCRQGRRGTHSRFTGNVKAAHSRGAED
jgi:hypothetical protein